MGKQRFASIEKSKLEAVLNENIRLRSAANKIWLKWWFVPLLLVLTFIAGFIGALAGTKW